MTGRCGAGVVCPTGAEMYPAACPVHEPNGCESPVTAPSPAAAGLPLEDARYAKFHVRVHASNRHAGYGKPVVVIARSRSEALARAIDLGWSGHRRDARVTFDRIEDIDPRECPHLTDSDGAR